MRMWIGLHGWGAPWAYLLHLDRKLNGGRQRFLKARWRMEGLAVDGHEIVALQTVYTRTRAGARLERHRHGGYVRIDRVRF
jgi:hypothetical protein